MVLAIIGMYIPDQNKWGFRHWSWMTKTSFVLVGRVCVSFHRYFSLTITKLAILTDKLMNNTLFSWEKFVVNLPIIKLAIRAVTVNPRTCQCLPKSVRPMCVRLYGDIAWINDVLLEIISGFDDFECARKRRWECFVKCWCTFFQALKRSYILENVGQFLYIPSFFFFINLKITKIWYIFVLLRGSVPP